MFLHIGGDDYVFKDDIVAILDRDTVKASKDTSALIEKMVEKGLLKNGEVDDVKTYIITCKRGRNNRGEKQYYLYTSNISTSTLLRRNNRWKQDWRLTKYD